MMIKPDAVQRGLVGTIIARFEQRGFLLRNMKFLGPDTDRVHLLRDHYSEHAAKSFYPGLIEFMTTGSIIPMVWEGNLEVAREMVGATVPRNATPGTIRGDYASSLPDNLIHCSDGPESALREIKIWF